MSVPIEEYLKRVDKFSNLHHEAHQQLLKVYEMYQFILKHEAVLMEAKEFPNEETKAESEKLLKRVQKQKADIESQLQRCMKLMEETAELKLFMEQITMLKAEESQN